MLLRQKIQFCLMILLTLFAFAAYHEGTGSVVWLQWLSVLSIMAFLLIFDLGFTDESNFIFDPDAENWRRKVVSCCESNVGAMSVEFPSFSLPGLWAKAEKLCFAFLSI